MSAARASRPRVHGIVDGTITFPSLPDHEGHHGLVGGEDVQARRSTFRSPTEAARWCEDVLDGTVRPRWTAAGPLVAAHTRPSWASAAIVVEDETGCTVARWTHRNGGWDQEP